MKNQLVQKLSPFILICMTLAQNACTTTGSNTETGIAVGAIAGAIAGAVIGNNVEDGSNDYYRNPDRYERHGRHYHRSWDDDNGGAEGALIGAAAGALIGGLIGNDLDRKEQEAEAARVEEYRSQREWAREQEKASAARAAFEEQQSVSRGSSLSETEVLEAEQRAKEAEQRLNQLRRDRLASLKRDQRLNQAEERRLSAEAEIERLEQELGITGYESSENQPDAQ
jgi:outer membrane lipoprotein SlyB